jgi:hypothetical protein
MKFSSIFGYYFGNSLFRPDRKINGGKRPRVRESENLIKIVAENGYYFLSNFHLFHFLYTSTAIKLELNF